VSVQLVVLSGPVGAANLCAVFVSSAPFDASTARTT